jgi:uncharacterized protein YkwD
MKPPARMAALAAAALLALTGCSITLPDNKGEIIITKPTLPAATATPTPPPAAEPEQPQPTATASEPAVADTPAPADTTPAAAAPELTPVLALSTEAAEVVRLTNLERTKRGLKPYAVNDCATTRAQAWSQTMATSRWLRHSDVRATMNACQATGASENIASGQRTPAEVVRAWMNSTGHRAAILSTNRTHIGVGVARTSTGRAYWTQVFLKNPLVGTTPTPSPTATATTPAPTPTATTPAPTPTATTPAPSPSTTAPSTERRYNGIITGYTFADNDPPNSNAIAHEDVMPNRTGAGGTGTYADPTTVAVPASEGHKPGDRFYLPDLRKYFIVEDLCAVSHSATSGCTSQFDVWVDGRGTPDGGKACMFAITDMNGQTLIIKNPASNYAVNPGIVANTCTQYGNTVVTQ